MTTEESADALPLLFLDFDGVLNTWDPPKGAHVRKHGPYRHAVIDGYPVWWRPSAVDFINRVHREGLAEVRWLTESLSFGASPGLQSGVSRFRSLERSGLVLDVLRYRECQRPRIAWVV